MESNDVYLVHFDGYLDGYGSQNYVLGVYSDYDLAREAVEEFKDQLESYIDDSDDVIIDIQTICLDHTYEIYIDSTHEVVSPIHLGGYVE